MNSFVKEIVKCFGKDLILKASTEKLKLELIIKNENYEKDEEETEADDDEDDSAKSEIEIELFEFQDGKYLLEFIKNKGEFPIYYQYFQKMKKIVCENL